MMMTSLSVADAKFYCFFLLHAAHSRLGRGNLRTTDRLQLFFIHYLSNAYILKDRPRDIVSQLPLLRPISRLRVVNGANKRRIIL